MGFGSSFSISGIKNNPGSAIGLATGGPLGYLVGRSIDMQNEAKADARAAQDQAEAAIAGDARTRAANITSLRETYGIGDTTRAAGQRTRLGAQIGQQVGNARETGLEQSSEIGSEGLRQSNIAASRTGTKGGTLGRRFAAQAAANYGQSRQGLASGLGNLRQGALASLAQTRSSMEASLAGGSPMDAQLNSQQQSNALRQYALGVPMQTGMNIASTLGNSAVQGGIANAQGYDVPDIFNIGKLTSSLSNKGTPGAFTPS